MELNNNKYIEELLEKYFEATATVAEEEELRAYFAQENVAPNLAQYKPMFNYFSEAKQEQFTGNIPLNSKKKKNVFYQWRSVAAVAVVCIGVYFGSGSIVKYQKQKEAEEAYAKTKEAFQLLADNLQKSKQQMVFLNEFEDTKQKIFKEQ